MNANRLVFFCLAGAALPAADYRVTGPHAVEHATLFLIHPARPEAAAARGRKYLPLKEALVQRKVAVYETGSVNELAIENLTQDTDIFIHSGDIVKGGRQDRVFSTDLILPPRSGRTPIESFCVEQGRWSPRGGEDAKSFSVSDNAIVSKEAKLAIKGSKNQSEVWKSVAGVQGRLALFLGGAGSVDGRSTGLGASASPTSLQLSLENKAVRVNTEKQVAALQQLLDGQADAIGYVFAVNGEIQSADVYSSPSLFRAVWPKQARALAIETIAESKKAAPARLTSEMALAFLNNAGGSKAPSTAAGPNKRTRVMKQDSAKVLFIESQDNASKSWVHRSYTAK